MQPGSLMHPLLHELGVSQEDVDAVQRAVREAKSSAHAERALEEFKAKARRGWRRRAFELHPDRTGGDADKTKRFVELQQLMQKVEAMRVDWQQRPYFSTTRPQPTRTVHVQYVRVTVSADGTTRTESASGPSPPDWAHDDDGALGKLIDEWLRVAGRRSAW
jgi:hypothetical protein